MNQARFKNTGAWLTIHKYFPKDTATENRFTDLSTSTRLSRLKICLDWLINSTRSKKTSTPLIKESHLARVSPGVISGLIKRKLAQLLLVFQHLDWKVPRK